MRILGALFLALLSITLSPNEMYAQGEHSYYGLRERLNTFTNECEIELTHAYFDVNFESEDAKYRGSYFTQQRAGDFAFVVVEKSFHQEYEDVWLSENSLIHFAERGFSESFWGSCKNEWYREGHVLPAPYDTLTQYELQTLKFQNYVGSGCREKSVQFFADLSPTRLALITDDTSPIFVDKVEDNHWYGKMDLVKFDGTNAGFITNEVWMNENGFVVLDTLSLPISGEISRCTTTWTRE